jgi:uncharacterized membrane protein YcaP (DUF421 family)
MKQAKWWGCFNLSNNYTRQTYNEEKIMASMLPDSAKEALLNAQWSVLSFFSVVIIFFLIARFVLTHFSIKSVVLRKVLFGGIAIVGILIASRVSLIVTTHLIK